MHYDFIAIPDADAPHAVDRTYQPQPRLNLGPVTAGVQDPTPESPNPLPLQAAKEGPTLQPPGGGALGKLSHKPVAVAAGLGHMGIHRNVIHPRFGNFIVLGTVLIDAEATSYGQPIDYNPCLECKLCVAACPVGAISPNGDFQFSNCLTHNYREFMSGFSDATTFGSWPRSGRRWEFPEDEPQ